MTNKGRRLRASPFSQKRCTILVGRVSGADFFRFVSVDAVTTKAVKSVVPIRELATNTIHRLARR